MVSAAASIVADLAITLLQGAVEISVVVLLASVRPWRYVFSDTYRKEVREQLVVRSPLLRAWYLLWGTLALLVSVGVVAAALWLFWPSPPKKDTVRSMEAAEQVLERVRALKGTR